MAKKKVMRQTVDWHRATEAPMKNVPIYVLFKVVGKKLPLCSLLIFRNSGVVPAKIDWGKTSNGEPQLPILWAYAGQIEPLVTPDVIADAKNAAWAWYKED